MLICSFLITTVYLKTEQKQDQKDIGFPRASALEEINYDWLQTWRESGIAIGYDIVLDNSSNVYLTGFSNLQACIIKYTNFGQQIWNKTYSGIDGVKSATIDDENNIYMAGAQGDLPYEDIFLLKVNQTGDILWYEEWGDLDQDYVASIEFNSKGDLYVLGSTYSYGAGEADIALLKYNQSGGLKWYKTWGYQWNDIGYDMFIDSNDSIYIVGATTLEWDHRYDICVIKYDSDGNQMFNSTCGIDNVYDHGYSIVLDSSQYIYVSGVRYEDLLLVKFGPLGNYIWTKTYDAGGNYLYIGNVLTLDESENLIVSYHNRILRCYRNGTIISEYVWNIEKYGETGYREEILALFFDSSENIYIAGRIDKDYTSSMFIMKCNSEFGTNKKSDIIFSYEKTYYEWFKTSMELNPVTGVYADRNWKAFVTFKIDGYNESFLIYLIDRGFVHDTIRIYVKNTASQIEYYYDIQMYTPYNFTYNKDIRYRVFFNYTYTYESCIRSDDGIYCDESEIKTVYGEYYSEYFSIYESDEDNSIPGFKVYFLIGLFIIMPILIYRRSKINVKRIVSKTQKTS